MDGYELKLDTFRGPLEKLLGLIEAKELEITQLSLAEVTADFLEYVRSLSEVDSRVLTDFIVIAARLILIKSRAILPQLTLSDEEEENIADLENRLRIYREFKRAEAHIEEYWQKHSAHAREYLFELPSGFYLTEKVSPHDLHGLMEGFYGEFQSFIPKIEEGKMALVSLEEMIEEMIIRVDKAMRTSFNDMAQGREKAEVIVLFLALLHLLKDSAVDIQQEGLFSDIQIISNNG